MTISSTTFKNQYTADGIVGTFPYTFRIIQSSDIIVVLTDTTTGIDTVQTITTDYSLTGVDNPAGGNVVFVSTPAAGLRITLARKAEAVQPEHYVENDPFPAASHELALDRVTTVSQTALEATGRSIQVPYGTDMSSFSPVLPGLSASYAGTAITVKEDLSGFEFLDIADGDVVGPDSSTDNAAVRFDGTTGKLVQNSSVIISDAGGVTATSLSTSQISGGSLVITGSTSVSIQGLTYPNSDGSAGDAIVTDGSGNLSFQSMPDGDVVGPASATDNAITRFDGATGKLIQDSSIVIDDTGNITGVNDLSASSISGTDLAIVGSSSVTIQGLTYPNTDGATGTVLTTDGFGVLSFQNPPDGDVAGPVSATDTAIVRFDGTTGKLIQDSVILINDTGSITGVDDIAATSVSTSTISGFNLAISGTSSVSIQGLAYPNTDGSAGYVLSTNGSGALSWIAQTVGISTVVVNSNTTMAGNTRYIVDSGPVDLTLPSSVAVGSVIEIIGAQANFSILQNSGQQIRFGLQTTTTGVSGSLTSLDLGSSITLVCTAVDTNFQVGAGPLGNYDII